MGKMADSKSTGSEPGRGDRTVQWIQCPNCWAARVDVSIVKDDEGHIEAIDIVCVLCDHERTVVP